MIRGVFTGGPIAGQVVFVPGNGKSPAYRNGAGAVLPKTTPPRTAAHYALHDGNYVWRPAQIKIDVAEARSICPECGRSAWRHGTGVDFVCNGHVKHGCGWSNLACRGCGLAPREGRHGIALCGACRTGEFAHLFEIGEELS